MSIVVTPTRTYRSRNLRGLYDHARRVERKHSWPPIVGATFFAAANGKTSVEIRYSDGSKGFASFADRGVCERWLTSFLRQRARNTTPVEKEPTELNTTALASETLR